MDTLNHIHVKHQMQEWKCTYAAVSLHRVVFSVQLSTVLSLSLVFLFQSSAVSVHHWNHRQHRLSIENNSCCYGCNNVVGSDYSFIRLLHLEVVFCFLTEQSQAARHSLSTWQQLFKCHFLLLQLAQAFPQLRNLLPFISERSPGDHCLCCHGKRQTLSECGLDFLIQ